MENFSIFHSRKTPLIVLEGLVNDPKWRIDSLWCHFSSNPQSLNAPRNALSFNFPKNLAFSERFFKNNYQTSLVPRNESDCVSVCVTLDYTSSKMALSVCVSENLCIKEWGLRVAHVGWKGMHMFNCHLIEIC